MQFRVLTIHAESSCSRGPELTQTERPSPVWWWLLTATDLISVPLSAPASQQSQTRTWCRQCCSHIHSYVTSQGPTLPAASSHLNCLGEAWRLSSLCHCDKMRRMWRWGQTVLPVTSTIKQVYPLKVLLRVQNMRRILKRSTFYNL